LAIRELDEPDWCNEGSRTPTCRGVVDHARLMLGCDLAFPISLSSDRSVMDGMHRACKALLETAQKSMRWVSSNALHRTTLESIPTICDMTNSRGIHFPQSGNRKLIFRPSVPRRRPAIAFAERSRQPNTLSAFLSVTYVC
jgi:hypothetical protein